MQQNMTPKIAIPRQPIITEPGASVDFGVNLVIRLIKVRDNSSRLVCDIDWVITTGEVLFGDNVEIVDTVVTLLLYLISVMVTAFVDLILLRDDGPLSLLSIADSDGVT